MDKQRNIADLIEDALASDEYKARINFLVAGLMFADPDIDADRIKKNKQLLKEMLLFCHKWNKDEEKSEHLKKTALRIEEYLEEGGQR